MLEITVATSQDKVQILVDGSVGPDDTDMTRDESGQVRSPAKEHAKESRPRWLFQREKAQVKPVRRPFGVPVCRPPKEGQRIKPYDNSLHTSLIVDLVAKGATAKRFAERVATAVAGPCARKPCTDEECVSLCGPHCDCDRCFVRAEMVQERLIPDAHLIDAETQTITAYEVEVSHRVSEYKFDLYRQWWFLIDEFYWTLRLVIVDRFGNMNEVDVLWRHALNNGPARIQSAL